MPEILVLDGLLGRGLPAVALPVADPALAVGVDDVGRVALDAHARGPLERLQALDHAAQLHAVVGRVRLAARELAPVLAADEDHGPAARARDCRRRRRRGRAAPPAVPAASGIGDLEHELAVLLGRPRAGRCASRTSSSGRTESTSGRMRPCAKRRVTARNSESLAIVEPSTSSCFQKMRWRRAGGLPPVVAPVEHEPPAAAERLDRGRPGVGADMLVDDVGAAPPRQLAHGREHVVAAMVDRRVAPRSRATASTLVARGGRDHARAERGGERHGRAARRPTRRPRRAPTRPAAGARAS